MGMTGFSDAEMALLSGLDAVAWVTRTRITYTDSFKREAVTRYRRGESPVRIFREAGLAPRIIGNEILPDGTKKTGIGALIRNTSLDEFPQFFNVLRGDMSFVGYRPERRVFVNRIIEAGGDYTQLFKTRPGVFSYATLYNGYTDTMAKIMRRLDMDLDYIQSRTIFTDIRVIALTAWSIISGKKF